MAAVVVEGAAAGIVAGSEADMAGADTSVDQLPHPSRIKRSSRPWEESEGRMLSSEPHCLYRWCRL